MINFPELIYVVTFIAGVISTVIVTPFWIHICNRLDWTDKPGPRKIHNVPIPRAGGLAILTGISISLGVAYLIIKSQLWVDSKSFIPISYGIEKRTPELIYILIGALGMSLVGWLDDQVNLKPFQKLLGQFFVATLLATSGIKITLFIPVPVFTYLLTVLWIVTVTNAMNLIDNMNGLCSGLMFIASFYIATYGAANSQYLTGAFGFLIAGAFLGFLPYNFPIAKAFLGDAGSHLAGFLIAILTILPEFYTSSNSSHFKVCLPLLFVAIPLLDMLRVIYVRWKIGHPIFQGDTRHISHLLVEIGLRPTTAVILIWLVSAIIGAIAFVV